MKKGLLKVLFPLTFPGAVVCSCSKKNSAPDSFTIAYANVQLNAISLVPQGDFSAHAYAALDIMSDNELNYDILCDTVPSGDTPGSFALYYGLPGQNGTLVQAATDIVPNEHGEAIGKIQLSQDVVDSFVNYASLYIVVESKLHPSGLMRAQISHAGSIGAINPSNSLKSIFSQTAISGGAFFGLQNRPVSYAAKLCERATTKTSKSSPEIF